MQRIQPMWRRGEPLRLTYEVRGSLAGLRLVVGDAVFVASLGEGSAEIVVPADRFSLVADGERVALQAVTPSGWESVATGFLVKEV